MQLKTISLYTFLKLLVIILVLIIPFTVQAQTKSTLTLKQAFELAEKNYPNYKQTALVKQTEALNIQNLGSAFLPQVNVQAQASYQSDVTQVSIPLPGVNIPSQSKDQYRISADISQLIYDGGMVKEQKKLQQLTTAIEENKLNIELYELKNRVFLLYFGILYQQELLSQTSLLKKDIQSGINKVSPLVENGVILRSNLLVLQAQQLQTQQREIEIRNSKKGLLNALEKLLNQKFEENTIIEKTDLVIPNDNEILRPELALLDQQKNWIGAQSNFIDAKNQPKVSAFVQGGYGRPGLNLLSNSFDTYYITGVRMNWSLSNFYNTKRDKKLLEISQRTIDLKKETFLLNTQTQLSQQESDINKFKELIIADKEITGIRKKISESAKAQLENAVITSNDYLREVNAEDLAKQTMIIHEIQLLQARVNYYITSGHF